MVFADCGVAIAPDAGELADIALATAHTVRLLLGWEPRVAMLSFSTKGSGEHESVDRVREAVRMAQDREPGAPDRWRVAAGRGYRARGGGEEGARGEARWPDGRTSSSSPT